MPNYKVYTKGNYLRIENVVSGEIKQFRRKDYQIEQIDNSGTEYFFPHFGRLLFANIVMENGSPYASISAFEVFYTANTGNFNSGGSVSPADLISSDPSNAIYLGGDGKLYTANGASITVVANYSALPAPNTVSGKFYWVSATQGTSWLPGSLGGNYYNKGVYYSNGTTWEFIDTPYQATQSEVIGGTENTKFVTAFTLSGWWSDIKTKVQTITAVWTFSGNVIAATFNSGTLSGNNSGDNATNTTSNSYADGKVANNLISSPSVAPSIDAVNIGLALKEDATNKANSMTGNTTSTVKFLSAKGIYDWAIGLFQLNLTDTILGTLLNSFTSKPTPIDADSISIYNSANGKANKWLLSDFKTYVTNFLQGIKVVYKNFTPGSAITGTTAETIAFTIPITGGEFSTSQLRIISTVSKTGTNGTLICRYQLNNVNSLTGAVQVGIFSVANTALVVNGLQRTFNITPTTLSGLRFSQSAGADDGASSILSRSSTSLDPSANFWLFLTVQLSNGADSIIPESCNVQKI